jgi:hypothetical protein
MNEMSRHTSVCNATLMVVIIAGQAHAMNEMSRHTSVYNATLMVVIIAERAHAMNEMCSPRTGRETQC